MILASLVVAAMTVSAALPPTANLVHFHPHAGADARISLTLVNQAPSFRDVKVGGHSYTIGSHGTLTIKAPVGTCVYADSRTPHLHRGDLMLEIKPELAGQNINLN